MAINWSEHFDWLSFVILFCGLVFEFLLSAGQANSFKTFLNSKYSWKFDLFSIILHFTFLNAVIVDAITFNYLKKMTYFLNDRALLPIQPQNLWQTLAFSFLYILIFDFFMYWLHRLKHSWEPLWQVHQFHHSTSELNAFSNVRVHSIDKIFRVLFVNAPMIFLFGPKLEILLPALLFVGTVECLAHSQLNKSYGPLGKFIVSPQFHRRHHSKFDPNKNYSIVFSFWDRLFSTYADSKTSFENETGLKNSTIENEGAIKIYFAIYYRFLRSFLNQISLLVHR